MAVAREGSDIRIINKPLDSQSGGLAVFLVETGKSQSLPETILCFVYLFSMTSLLQFPGGAIVYGGYVV